MTLLWRGLAFCLASALVLLSPGLDAYAAAGRAAGVKATGSSAPAIPVGLKAVPALGAALNLAPQSGSPAVFGGLSSVGTVGTVGAAAPTPAAISATTILESAGATAVAPQPSASTPESTLQRLAAPLPQFERAGDGSRDSAHEDFMRRAGGRSALEPAAVFSDPVSPLGRQPSLQAAKPASRAARSWIAKAARLEFGRPQVPVFAASLLGSAMLGAGLISTGRLQQAVLLIPMLVVSFALHEIGHARMAYTLGDRRSELADRMLFNPRSLMTHIDPWWTIAMPLLGFVSAGLLFGMARPVMVENNRFKRPRAAMALVALAGPAVNVVLAGIGAIAFAGFGAAGFPALSAAAALFAALNVSLAVFNLIPLHPLDGHHIAQWLMPKAWADNLEGFYAKGGWLALLPLISFILAASKFGLLTWVVGGLTAGLLGGSAALFSAMGAVIPTAMVAGMIFAAKPVAGPPALTPGAAAPVESLDGQKPVEYVVMLRAAVQPLSADQHLSFIDLYARDGVGLYARAEQSMLEQLQTAGVPSQGLVDRGAVPIATYRRINATTLRVDASRAPQLKQWLESLGHTVYDNSRRRIYPPITNPEDADPAARNPVTLAENTKITKADAVIAIAKERFGDPQAGALRRAWRKLARQETAPQVPIGFVDTGADLSHPLLKGVTLKNVTSGPAGDDNGHGSWVTSMSSLFTPWLRKSVTHYQAFVGGGATLDDILKALTMAGNDGNIVISNSWGSDDGDPTGPDATLVAKLAEEGHIMVFAAGNSGPGANTIGSPAIVQYKDPATGVIRVVAVAAAGRDKKIASFSSRGPGSPATQKDAQWPHRPDLSGIGYNVEGAWPANNRPDRVDPVSGPVKAISGTSMSTPEIASAIRLLAMMFGVTTKGAKLDAVVGAVLGTLEKTGQAPDAEGGGFINVEAAYRQLENKFR